MAKEQVDHILSGTDKKISVDRHYRLSIAAYNEIKNRDMERFPTEKDFLTEAILSYKERRQMDELLKRYDVMIEKLEMIIKAMGWQ